MYFLAMQLIEEELIVGHRRSNTGEKERPKVSPIRSGIITIK